MSDLLVVRLGNTVQKRFYVHKYDGDDLITVRMKSFVVSPGADVYRGEERLGMVNCVKPAPMDRWRVTLIMDAPTETILLDQLDKKLVELLVENGMQTVEEVQALTYDELITIKGIGPATARKIQAALSGK